MRTQCQKKISGKTIQTKRKRNAEILNYNLIIFEEKKTAAATINNFSAVFSVLRRNVIALCNSFFFLSMHNLVKFFPWSSLCVWRTDWNRLHECNFVAAWYRQTKKKNENCRHLRDYFVLHIIQGKINDE